MGPLCFLGIWLLAPSDVDSFRLKSSNRFSKQSDQRLIDFITLENDRSTTTVQCGHGWGDLPPPKSQDRLGEYILLECLGGGDHGEVWKATNARGDTVAVKIERPGHLNPVDLQSECLFSQMVSQIDESHFVACHELGEVVSSGTVRRYMVMDFVQGQTVNAHLSSNGGKIGSGKLLPIISLLSQLATAWESMFSGYQRGSGARIKFICKDLQPDNVMIAFHEGSAEPRVKLIDYGRGKMCCAGEGTERCTATLKNGTNHFTSGQVWQTLDIPSCTLEAAHSARAANLAAAAYEAASTFPLFARPLLNPVACEEGMRQLSAKGVTGIRAELEGFKLLARSPLNFVAPYVIEDLRIADEGKPGTTHLFQEALSLIYRTYELEWWQALETGLPRELPSKLRVLLFTLKAIFA